MLARVWRKGNPSALLVEMQTGAATGENSKNFLKKLKVELPFDLAIPLPWIYPQNSKTPIQKDLYTTVFIAVLSTIGKVWKQFKFPSVDE